MSLRLLSDDLIYYILCVAVRTAVQSVETHARTEHMYAFLTRAQYIAMAQTALFTRTALDTWLNRPLGCQSIVRELAEKSASLGPEFSTALTRLRGEKGQFGPEYVTRSIRRLIATTTAVGVMTNWAPMKGNNGTTLACAALYSQPLIAQLSRTGVVTIDDSSIFAPTETKHVWLRQRAFPAECLPHENSATGITLSKLFECCVARWGAYQLPASPKKPFCNMPDCEHRGHCAVSLHSCVINTSVSYARPFLST